MSDPLPSEHLPHHDGLLGSRALQEAVLPRPAQPAGRHLRPHLLQDHRGLGPLGVRGQMGSQRADPPDNLTRDCVLFLVMCYGSQSGCPSVGVGGAKTEA